ncbi:thiamine phosphate synthase, partial [Serratia ureilytica]|nr:thiamine phosphate synthase [Serratia ureilytica]
MLEAGVTTIQLRIKDLPDEQVEEDIAAAIALGRRYQARLFINDYWRLAIRHAGRRGPRHRLPGGGIRRLHLRRHSRHQRRHLPHVVQLRAAQPPPIQE